MDSQHPLQLFQVSIFAVENAFDQLSNYYFTIKATPGAANGTAMQQQAGQQVQAAAGGQPDYSKQWAEYYRNIGKIEEAEAIENQMKAAKVRIFFSNSLSSVMQFQLSICHIPNHC